MNRDRLDPILGAGWTDEKKKQGYPEDRPMTLAWRNRELEKLLSNEPQDVKDAVDRFREDDIVAKLAALEALENKELLRPSEANLPEGEKERLRIGRQRFRCVASDADHRTSLIACLD